MSSNYNFEYYHYLQYIKNVKVPPIYFNQYSNVFAVSPLEYNDNTFKLRYSAPLIKNSDHSLTLDLSQNYTFQGDIFSIESSDVYMTKLPISATNNLVLYDSSSGKISYDSISNIAALGISQVVAGTNINVEAGSTIPVISVDIDSPMDFNNQAINNISKIEFYSNINISKGFQSYIYTTIDNRDFFINSNNKILNLISPSIDVNQSNIQNVNHISTLDISAQNIYTNNISTLSNEIIIKADDLSNNITINTSGLNIVGSSINIDGNTINLDGNTINLGNPNTTINMYGALNNIETVNLEVTDQLIRLNKNGIIGTAYGSGIEIEANGNIVSYIKTDPINGTSYRVTLPNNPLIYKMCLIDPSGYIDINGIENDLQLDGSLDISKNAIVNGTLSVYDNSFFNNVNIVGSLNLGGDVDICGNVGVSGNIEVSGNSYLYNVDICNNLNVGSDIDISGNVSIYGTTTFSGNVSIYGSTTFNENVKLDNLSNINKTLLLNIDPITSIISYETHPTYTHPLSSDENNVISISQVSTTTDGYLSGEQYKIINDVTDLINNPPTQVLYVDTCGNDTSGYGSIISPFKTIQTAINNCNDIDKHYTIYIGPETFNENIIIGVNGEQTISPHISIIGLTNNTSSSINGTVTISISITPGNENENIIALKNLSIISSVESSPAISLTGQGISLYINNCDISTTSSNTSPVIDLSSSSTTTLYYFDNVRLQNTQVTSPNHLVNLVSGQIVYIKNCEFTNLNNGGGSVIYTQSNSGQLLYCGNSTLKNTTYGNVLTLQTNPTPSLCLIENSIIHGYNTDVSSGLIVLGNGTGGTFIISKTILQNDNSSTSSYPYIYMNGDATLFSSSNTFSSTNTNQTTFYPFGYKDSTIDNIIKYTSSVYISKNTVGNDIVNYPSINTGIIAIENVLNDNFQLSDFNNSIIKFNSIPLTTDLSLVTFNPTTKEIGYRTMPTSTAGTNIGISTIDSNSTIFIDIRETLDMADQGINDISFINFTNDVIIQNAGTKVMFTFDDNLIFHPPGGLNSHISTEGHSIDLVGGSIKHIKDLIGESSLNLNIYAGNGHNHILFKTGNVNNSNTCLDIGETNITLYLPFNINNQRLENVSEIYGNASSNIKLNTSNNFDISVNSFDVSANTIKMTFFDTSANPYFVSYDKNTRMLGYKLIEYASATTTGLLTNTDWMVFNGKESVLTFNSPLSRIGNVISVNTATTSTSGILTFTDWNTFNNKITTIIVAGQTAYLSYNSESETLTLSIPNADASTTGLLTSTDWNNFDNKENVLFFYSPLKRTGNNITFDLSASNIWTGVQTFSDSIFMTGIGSNTTSNIIYYDTGTGNITYGALPSNLLQLENNWTGNINTFNNISAKNSLTIKNDDTYYATITNNVQYLDITSYDHPYGGIRYYGGNGFNAYGLLCQLGGGDVTISAPDYIFRLYDTPDNSMNYFYFHTNASIGYHENGNFNWSIHKNGIAYFSSLYVPTVNATNSTIVDLSANNSTIDNLVIVQSASIGNNGHTALSTLDVRSGDASGTIGWISGVFGANSNADRVVIGNLRGKATIGAHLNNLTSGWGNLYINRDVDNVGGATYIGPTLYVGDASYGSTIYLGGGGEGDGGYSNSVIETRDYSGNDNTELLLFKGNDPYSDPSGGDVDRIRLKAGEIRFDVYTGFSTDRTSQSTAMIIGGDPNNRLKVFTNYDISGTSEWLYYDANGKFGKYNTDPNNTTYWGFNEYGTGDMAGLFSRGNVSIGNGHIPLRALDVRSGNALDTDNWISGVFGANGNADRVIIGNLRGKATIGAHLNNLDGWGDLYINRDIENVGGNTYIGPTLYVGDASYGSTIYLGGGASGDNGYDHSVIETRQYVTGGFDQTELLLFKGNDPYANIYPNLVAGPDRIRLKAGEIRFDVFTGGFTTDRNSQSTLMKLGSEHPLILYRRPNSRTDVTYDYDSEYIYYDSGGRFGKHNGDGFWYIDACGNLNVYGINNRGGIDITSDNSTYGNGYTSRIENVNSELLIKSKNTADGLIKFYVGNGRTDTPYHGVKMLLGSFDHTFRILQHPDDYTKFVYYNYLGDFGTNSWYITSGGQFSGSDRRLKKNISYLDTNKSINFIKRLKPCIYNMIDSSDNKVRHGFIAQDVLEVAETEAQNSLVGLLTPSRDASDNIIDEEQYLSLNYMSFIPEIVQANKEMIYKIEKLEEEVVNINIKNNVLQSQVDTLMEEMIKIKKMFNL